jgi:tyrosinase
MRHWDLQYKVQRYALNGTFFVHVFIGDFESDHGRWIHERNHVHVSCVWVRSLLEETGQVTSCANCLNLANAGAIYADWVPLTMKLIEYIASGEEHPAGSGLVLNSMDPVDVIPFLTRNLHWRIVDVRMSRQICMIHFTNEDID